jgi:hypothetical protein
LLRGWLPLLASPEQGTLANLLFSTPHPGQTKELNSSATCFEFSNPHPGQQISGLSQTTLRSKYFLAFSKYKQINFWRNSSCCSSSSTGAFFSLEENSITFSIGPNFLYSLIISET